MEMSEKRMLLHPGVALRGTERRLVLDISTPGDVTPLSRHGVNNGDPFLGSNLGSFEASGGTQPWRGVEHRVTLEVLLPNDITSFS